MPSAYDPAGIISGDRILPDWRERLKLALEQRGRSARSVSLAAGYGHQYVHSLLTEGKEPSVDRLAAVAKELDVSLSWLIYGIEIDAEAEEFLQLLRDADPQTRQGVLAILRARKGPVPE